METETQEPTENLSTGGAAAPAPRGSHWREKYRVRISFVFALIFIWRVQPRNIGFLAAGFLIALAGILLRQWAAGCVRKMDELATTGPYALMRHPLYAGSFLAAAGMVLSASSFSIATTRPYLDRTLFFWAFLWILVDSIYKPKIESEEQNLREKFGPSYDEYAARVPRILPRRLRWSDLDFSTFSFQLWKKNAEYGSVIGFILIYAVIVARFIYR